MFDAAFGFPPALCDAVLMARSTDEPLGATVRALREARGVSREVLAVDAGISTGTLARLELGKSDPPWSTLRAVATALELTVSELASAIETGTDKR